MKGLILLLVALTGTLVYGRNEALDGEVDINRHLQHLASNRFPIDQNENNRHKVQEYIKECFQNSGLSRHEHRFNTTVRNQDDEDEVVEGVNIIGINEHDSDEIGGILLIGADYDTPRAMCQETDGQNCLEYLQNNGVGVAAMLEIARLFDHNTRFSGDWRNDITTIFVAFDINTKEHIPGSPGQQGSKKFLEEWLWDYLGQSKEHFGGAIIIDSITKLNYENNTQQLGNTFKKTFPSAHERISERGSKGDFLAVVSNGDDTIGKLKDQFKMQYELKMKMKKPFVLEDLELEGRIPTDVLPAINHQAHYNFWTFKDSDKKPQALPAMLLTDTENERRLPENQCAGKPCQLRDYMNDKDRKSFVEYTVNAVVGTLLQRQAHRVPESGAMNNLPSIMASLLLMIFVKLLQ